MRPKKTILLVDANEERRSLNSFKLHTRGYRVFAASNADDALAITDAIDLAIVNLPEGNDLIRAMKKTRPEMRTILMGTEEDVPCHDADMLMHEGASGASLLERVRVLVERRRGPKKHLIPPPASFTQPMECLMADEDTQ